MVKVKESLTVRIALTLIFLFAVHHCSTAARRPQSAELVGRWKVEITFANQFSRTLRFEAEASGKGSLLLEGPASNWAEAAKPTTAKWSQSAEQRVTISGPVEFPIGNVGRLAGTLICKGKFDTENSLSGEVALFAPEQDPQDPQVVPSRTGTFKATRVTTAPTSR
ncbi:MAG: hypothetical protein HYR56_05445 [Acidobacteria bacterium]|nr:hypothetical protein [Acidobacteriota bacterium]